MTGTKSIEREYGTSHRPKFTAALLAPRFWGIWSGYLIIWALRFVPRRVRGWIAAALAPVALLLPSGKRDDARANLEACFPELDIGAREKLLRRHVRIQFEVYLAFGELMFLPRERLLSRFEVVGDAALRSATEAGRGVLILAPHTCAFEWAGQCVAMLHPVVSMARLHKDNAAMDWIINRMRLRFGGLVFGNEKSMVPLIKAVRGGRWMFYLPDEDRRNPGGVFVPFFGVPKLTIPSIGRLATACRAKVFPMRARYLPETHKIRVEFLPALEDFPVGDAETDAACMNEVIESILAPDPAQYAWTQRIFRSRPTGAPRIY